MDTSKASEANLTVRSVLYKDTVRHYFLIYVRNIDSLTCTFSDYYPLPITQCLISVVFRGKLQVSTTVDATTTTTTTTNTNTNTTAMNYYHFLYYYYYYYHYYCYYYYHYYCYYYYYYYYYYYC